ncbi:MAG: winged helix-turn-helix domain-containing protein [Methanobacteriaceae archaeon]|nr:winged helix-turn-helix domain-containing protein [Methanobacteriaceae archaeon]MDP2837508.1 winged helix-turn-helix domain-containing protein [Methanobacteriaceae archaeon]MDP3034744.1 winged helix-turn-helix domain-containing protein [Methanobacteriaceae archaeon]MDP3484118.1 winged helix-turn-helix domain-containing protein [Methanobacteriaceae archaeon]
MKKLLWWLIAGSTGGPNRGRIIIKLNKKPHNANQLTESLNLNYKTVRHHLKVLEENKVITSSGKKYGDLYFLSDKIIENYADFKEIWQKLDIDGEKL